LDRNKVILACTHEDAPAAAGHRCRLAHLDYRIDPGGRLRRTGPAQRGGYLVISAACSQPVPADPRPFAAQMVRECGACGFSGVIADFEGEMRPECARFLAALGREAAARGLHFLAPVSAAEALPESAKLLLPSGLSGGSFRAHLEEHAARWGRRLVLDLSQNREDFPMPCSDGCGNKLGQREMDALCGRYLPRSFFSEDLQTNYFTYRDPAGGLHCVLYDTAATMRDKAELALTLGAEACIVLYGELGPLLRELLDRE